MKDLSSQIFGKALSQLGIDDLEDFFSDEIEESNILEFKSGQDTPKKFDDVLNTKIIRAITSFLNSEGGILIWGAPTKVEKDINGRMRNRNVLKSKILFYNEI